MQVNTLKMLHVPGHLGPSQTQGQSHQQQSAELSGVWA